MQGWRVRVRKIAFLIDSDFLIRDAAFSVSPRDRLIRPTGELNAHRIYTFHLDSFIDFFVSSCYVHIRKPDSNIFRMALDTAQASPDQVIYIDNVQTFVDIATDLGIKSIRHTDCLSTSKALASMGLEVEQNKMIYG